MRGSFLDWSSAECMINEGQVYWNVGLEIVKTIPQAPESPSPTKNFASLRSKLRKSRSIGSYFAYSVARFRRIPMKSATFYESPKNQVYAWNLVAQSFCRYKFRKIYPAFVGIKNQKCVRKRQIISRYLKTQSFLKLNTSFTVQSRNLNFGKGRWTENVHETPSYRMTMP